MYKGFAAVLAALMLVPALAWAQIEISVTQREEGENSLAVFSAAQALPEAPGQTAQPEQTAKPGQTAQPEQTAQTADSLLLAVNQQIEARFMQSQAEQLLVRAGAQVQQTASLYQIDQVVSMALLWQGTQVDGLQGSTAYTLTLDLETGLEVTFDQLFADPDAAVAAMEAIIERDVLQNMSGYLEYANLLPMPRNCFSFDETGLTVYYQDDAYRNYDGTSGSVTFYWYELADYIGEDSPVYELADRKQNETVDPNKIQHCMMLGRFPVAEQLEVGMSLGALETDLGLTLLEANYTTNSRVYTFAEPDLRGFAVEIPKYADTEEMQTPITAIRASRIDLYSVVTGETTRGEVVALLGEPDKTLIYDEDDAFDMMLTAGESLCYQGSRFVLEVHLDEAGVVSCLILRETMPEEMLY